MAIVENRRPNAKRLAMTLLFPALFLCAAYGILALTLVHNPGDLMQRCVLMNLKLARIWSVAHVEIGMSYFGVFLGMTYYLVRAGRSDKTHLLDLTYALCYLICSFILDFTCVRFFSPFKALLIGDAVVMTFTLMVSKQIWFQRLLGIFVPLVFITCAIGHFMEGFSFWQLTYPVNVPWTMVTADIGFAILVNASRFPAFIRGHDFQYEIDHIKATADERQKFLTDVLSSVTNGKLKLALDENDLPEELPMLTDRMILRVDNLSSIRHAALFEWRRLGFAKEREPDMLISVGEAIMNAVVHGKDGIALIRGNEDRMQICIEDKGPGIKIEHLPRATLEKGYSSAGSLGQGFWIILQTIDCLDLLTNSSGTKLILTYDRLQAPLEYAFLET